MAGLCTASPGPAWAGRAVTERPRRPKGHRALLKHLVEGGLIQQDDSGLAWVSPTRSGEHPFTNEAVAYLRERGFSHFDDDDHQRHRYAVVDAPRQMLKAVVDVSPAPMRKRKPKKRPE